MVNTGKPSRGCYLCRARRIKCDEGKPSCQRCIKSKRICPGYRDEFQLKLRGESKSTKKKQMHGRTSPDPAVLVQEPYSSFSFNSSSPHPSNNYPSLEYSPRHARAASIGIPYHSSHHASPEHHFGGLLNLASSQLTTPLHQQATCYFLSNFVLVPQQGTMRGYLDFVIPLLKKPQPEKSLAAAFTAIAFAALGSRPNSKSLLHTADIWYIKALKEISSALQNPKLASSDSIVASVMMMVSYEQLTPSRSKIAGWESHIDGAIAIIKSRPRDSWNDYVSREMFIAVRAHMTIHCIATSKAVDPSVDWLGVQAADPIVQSFSAINIKMAALGAANDLVTTSREYTPENTEKVLGVLRRAEALEQEYIAWQAALPPSWDIQTVDWIDDLDGDISKSTVHPGRVDGYGELWMAYKHNIVRSCRIYIWIVILRSIAWLNHEQDYRLTPEYAAASLICQKLVEDIVASVPYFFGWSRGKNSAMADRSNYACGTQEFTPKPLSGIFGMWPFFSAASSDFATPSQVQFLRGKLKLIAETMGINQAGILFQAQLRFPSMIIMRERMGHLPVGQANLAQKMDSITSLQPTPPAESRPLALLSANRGGPLSPPETAQQRLGTARAMAWKAGNPGSPRVDDLKPVLMEGS